MGTITRPTCNPPSRPWAGGRAADEFLSNGQKLGTLTSANVNETGLNRRPEGEQIACNSVREAGVGGSNPLTPTIHFKHLAENREHPKGVISGRSPSYSPNSCPDRSRYGLRQ